MLTNTKLIDFVNRVAANHELRTSLEADFDGTLSANGIALSGAERESLKASYRYLRAVDPMTLESRIAAGGGGATPAC
ncbi:MAG TPA: hypothetical protein V6D00_01475 [Pantanalinema sp.]